MQVISGYSVKYGGKYYAPGTPIDMKDRDAEDAIEAQKVTAVAERQEAAEEEKELTVAELKERAAALGIDVDQIDGTGANGRVLKVDIAKAIEDAESEDAAAAAGVGTTEVDNPSVVE